MVPVVCTPFWLTDGGEMIMTRVERRNVILMLMLNAGTEPFSYCNLGLPARIALPFKNSNGDPHHDVDRHHDIGRGLPGREQLLIVLGEPIGACLTPCLIHVAG